MKDHDISSLLEGQEVPSEEAEIEANMEEAAALIDSFVEPEKEAEMKKSEMYEKLREVTDKELLEVVYDITSSKFLILSTAPGDEGSIVNDDYLQRHAPEVLEILSEVEVLNLDLEKEVAITDLRDFPLVEVA